MLIHVSVLKELLVVVSSAPSLFQRLVRCLVLRLALLLGGRVGARVMWLRLEIAGLAEGSRRRFKLEIELERLEGLLAWLEDPETYDDPVNRWMIAEAAARGVDPGRRAWIRWRWIYGWGCRAWRRVPVWAREGAKGALLVARCRCALG